MPKFRKKPVVIEARELRQEDFESVKEWCGGGSWTMAPLRAVCGLTIPTLEGVMHAQFGDWIICGVKGEFYPCAPDIFEATYDPVTDA